MGKEKNFPFQELGALAVRSRAPARGRNALAGCTVQLEGTGHRRGQATASSPLGSVSCEVLGSKPPAADRPSTLHPGGGVKDGLRHRDDAKHQVRGTHHTKVGFTDFRSIARPGTALTEVLFAGGTPVMTLHDPSLCPVAKGVSLVPAQLLGLRSLQVSVGLCPSGPRAERLRDAQRRVLIPSARLQPL